MDDGGGLLSETIICEVGPSHQIEQKTTSEIVFSTSKVVFPTSEKNFSTSEVDFADDVWPDVGFCLLLRCQGVGDVRECIFKLPT